MKSLPQRMCDIFYPTVCHVCKSIPAGPEKMKFCSGCRLVQYCTEAHQKMDWHSHKSLCHAVQHIMKRTGAKHVFEEVHEFTSEDLSSWNKLRPSVMKLVQLITEKSLNPVENQILLFPPVCHYCLHYEANSMIPCSSCSSVLYCCVEHEQSDEKHKSNCKQLRLSFTIDLLRFFNQSDYKVQIDIKKLSNLKKMPQNMECLSKYFQEKSFNEFIQLSEFLSYTLTLVFAIHKVGNLISNELTIHVIGADAMEVSSVETISVLLHLMPFVSQLKVVLIGPNVTNRKVPPVSVDNCQVSIVSKLYHDYVNSGSCAHPDVIAVFNCGFCEHKDVPEKDTWKLSLRSIANVKNSTVILTSYTLSESHGDMKRLCDNRDKWETVEKVLDCQENPYSSLYPHRDWENHGSLFYVNKYISVLNM